MADHMARYRTIRLEVFEVWEDGKGELPLFICSDVTTVQKYVADNPGDTFTRRWWTREGGPSDVASPPGPVQP